MNFETKKKIKIGVVFGIYALIILVLSTLLLEGLGTFVGFICDRPFASVYIKNTYSDIDCEFENAEYINEKRTVLGVEQNYKSYRFNYKVKSMDKSHGTLKTGDVFSVDAYNFKVTRDSVYMDYNLDAKLLDELNVSLENELNELTQFNVFDAYIDVKLEVGKFESLSQVLESDVIGESDEVLHIIGEKLDFDAYKAYIAPLVAYYQDENKSVKNPCNVQVFYYYTNSNGDKVMQYETELEHYQLSFSESTIKNGEKMHYKVELSEDEAKKMNIYNIVKYVYLIVLGGTVIVLYTLWTIRKIKKLMRQKEK